MYTRVLNTVLCELVEIKTGERRPRNSLNLFTVHFYYDVYYTGILAVDEIKITLANFRPTIVLK